MKITDVTGALEQIAPPAYAANWDNVGLLLGDTSAPCGRALLCIDFTPAVLAEAKAVRAQLVMAYHPVIFKPLAKLTATDAPVVWQAARMGLAVYSVHTAYDAAVGGANDALGDALGMSTQRRPLEPLGATAVKLVVFLPAADLPAVSQAAFAAGAGHIGQYSQCGFMSSGVGTFLPGQEAHPSVGQAGKQERVNELRWEVHCPQAHLVDVVAAIRAAHSYEEPAIDIYPLAEATAPAGVGMGRVGRLDKPVSLATAIQRIKHACGVREVLLARPISSPAPGGRSPSGQIRTIAVSAGSAGSLWRAAASAQADLYVTGELRHHDALAAMQAGLTVICVGHSNSERLALGRLAKQLEALLPALKVSVSRADVDPFTFA